jgi:putative ABC transport system ATP-binding protein
MLALDAREIYRFFHVGEDEIFALRGVSLTLSKGETVALMGPSGSGKSTLLSCLTGLDEPDGGAVIVGGVRLTRQPESERARFRAVNFGILRQSRNLFHHLTVAQNIRFQMILAGRKDEARVIALIAAIGLAHRANSYASQLSGGEAALVGLAVALAADPPILVADEPTAEVDSKTESRLIAHLEDRRRQGLTTLLATHSEKVAASTDRVVRLKDGRIVDS